MRDHHTPKVQAAMARRDQLSGPFALHLAGMKPGILAIDNLASEFHTWLHFGGRKAERRLWKDATTQTSRTLIEEFEFQRCCHAKLQEEHDTLHREAGELPQKFDRLQQERDRLLNDDLESRQTLNGLRHMHDWLVGSKSWRITAPLRALNAKTAF